MAIVIITLRVPDEEAPGLKLAKALQLTNAAGYSVEAQVLNVSTGREELCPGGVLRLLP